MFKNSCTTFANPFTYEISTFINYISLNFIQLYSHFIFNHSYNLTRTLKKDTHLC